MRLRRVLAALLIALGAVCALAQPACADDTGAWQDRQREGIFKDLSAAVDDIFHRPNFYWDRGPTLKTQQGALAFHGGLEVQYDTVWYGGMDDEVEAVAGSERWESGGFFRRFRFAIEGFVLRNWYFRVRYRVNQVEEPTLDDAFIEWSGFKDAFDEDWPALRLGQVKEPMTIDWMNGAKWLVFAERAMFTTTLVPNRTPGIRLHGTVFDQRMNYQIGWFSVNENLDEFRNGDGEAVTARLAGTPFLSDCDEDKLLHLGVSGTYRWDVGTVQFQARPESWLGTYIVDTGGYEADKWWSVATELFWQQKKFSFLWEQAWTTVELPDGELIRYGGYYVAASYFVIGKGINYNRRFAAFGRIRPEGTLICPRTGIGDLELTARYSWIDLQDGPFPGGRAYGVTLGCNWYPRDNMKVTLNYMYHNVDNAYGDPLADGDMNTLLLRLQYDL